MEGSEFELASDGCVRIKCSVDGMKVAGKARRSRDGIVKDDEYIFTSYDRGKVARGARRERVLFWRGRLVWKPIRRCEMEREWVRLLVPGSMFVLACVRELRGAVHCI